jgi:hypothetical protein
LNLNQRTFTQKTAERSLEFVLEYMKKFTFKIRAADPDPHHFGKLDPDPEPHFGALEGPYLEKREW